MSQHHTPETARIEVRRADGWETVQFENVEKVTVAGVPGSDGLRVTLIGHREGQANQVKMTIVDAAGRHESLVYNEVLAVSA